MGVAAALPTALAGAPWWAIAACVVLVPLDGQLQGLLCDRVSRKLDTSFMATINELEGIQEKTRILIEYRRADRAEPTGAGTDDGQPEDAGSS